MNANEVVISKPSEVIHKRYFLLSFDYWVSLESSPRKDVRFVLAEDLNDAINKLRDCLSGIVCGSIECKNIE
jgi:hypothetical protein